MATNYPDFLKVFDELPDPRHHRTRRHSLFDILFIALCSALTGGKSFVDMEDLAIAQEGWFKQYIPMVGGPPSHDTFNRVFQMINPERFETCFRAWTQHIKKTINNEIIAVDGKCNRGSGSQNKSPISLVNAWSCENELVLGQLLINENSNEIKAIPELLKELDLKNTVVTADAMNCQKKTAATIIEGGGNYVLALKQNQKILHEEVKLFLDELSNDTAAQVKKVEKGHGRLETRTYWQTDDIDGFVNCKQWPGLRTFGMVHSIREKPDGKVTEESRYYISSLSLNPQQFADAVRAHWGVENKLHWRLDVVFGEDQNRARTKNASRNLSTLRKMALNIVRKEPGNKGMARKMRCALANPNNLKVLLELDV